jgi:hypothetical protein
MYSKSRVGEESWWIVMFISYRASPSPWPWPSYSRGLKEGTPGQNKKHPAKARLPLWEISTKWKMERPKMQDMQRWKEPLCTHTHTHAHTLSLALCKYLAIFQRLQCNNQNYTRFCCQLQEFRPARCPPFHSVRGRISNKELEFSLQFPVFTVS